MIDVAKARLVRLAVAVSTTVCVSAGCGSGSESDFVAVESQQREPTWIDASQDAQAEVPARQLRGLDVAMLELDRRYAEVYFAGREANWPYAGRAALFDHVVRGAMRRTRGRCSSWLDR